MKIIYPSHHAQHASPYEIFNGQQDSHQEVPARLETILTALRQHGFEPESLTQQAPSEALTEVHSSEYIQFLTAFSEELGVDEYRYPSVFQYRTGKFSTSPLAQLGYYSFDLYTPMGKNTFQAALDSASCAYQIAQELVNNDLKIGYALGRPPGHHAEPSQMGGYCYLNNAAIAAEFLAEFGKVATLDVDFHHGNGTQAIFYDRSDVLTVSIHADPNWKFPFFSGGAEEIGSQEGEGFNRNFPLQKGVTDHQYQAVLEQALTHIADFSADYLVVSFGADTHEADPIGGFSLSTTYFRQMAQTISELNLPTVIVQEGGYNTSLLGENVVSFLQGFNS